MNVQFKGLNPLQALQQKQKAAQQKKADAQPKLLNQLKQDAFEKKDPKFGGCCG